MKLAPLPDESVYENIEALNLGITPDAQSWGSAQSDIFETLTKKHQPKTIIEVGSWKGVSARKWAFFAGPQCKVYCVDTWLSAADAVLKPSEEKAYQEPRRNGHLMVYWTFLTNIKHWGLTKHVVPIVNTSSIGSDILKAHGITAPIIYIDGDHSYRACYQDLCDYWDLLTPGGSMLVDDFKIYQGVYAACLRFVEERQLWKSHTTVDDHTFCLLEKPLS